MDQSNDNIEEFSFKPLTDGLGFKKDINLKQFSSKHPVKHPTIPIDSFNTQKNEPKIDMGELTPFYSSEKKLTTPLDIISNTRAVRVNDNIKLRRFFSYLFDIGVVALLFLASLFPAMNLLNLKFDMFTSNSFLLNTFPLFSAYYIFYFSVLEKSNYSTLGKNLFNLKLKQANLTYWHTVVRSFFSLISLFCLGMPSYFGMHEILSETYIVEK